jgi:hypothetical protein
MIKLKNISLSEKHKEYNDKQSGYLKAYRKKNTNNPKNTCKEYRRKKVFKILSFSANNCYNNGNITAFDLWNLAKRQKAALLCLHTGQRLTRRRSNVSV